MRNFTYVAGTSSKFWEVDRDGTSVTVRFGRIGTNGQTQVKDLVSEEKAKAHVDKLVAEKVAKGYVEELAGAATASSAAVQPAKAPATAPIKAAAKVSAKAPAKASAKTPAKTPAKAATAGKPGKPTATKNLAATATASGPTVATEVVDEDLWQLPATWARQAEPWRGRIPGKAALDQAAAALAASVHRAAEKQLEEVLSHSGSDPELVAAARLHRGTSKTLLRKARQESNPLGAAVLDLVAKGQLEYNKERERLSLVEARVAEQGLAFAVQVAMLMQTITIQDPSRPQAHYYSRSTTGAVMRVPVAQSYYGTQLLVRLRALLASTDDATYAQAVAAAEATRAAGFGARVASSYLLPTEQRWVDADVAEVVASGRQDTQLTDLLWASVATRAQADTLRRAPHGGLSHQTSLLYTAATVLGSDSAPLLLMVFDGYGDAASKKRVLSLVGQLPTDEAFEGMLARLDEKYVSAALLEPMGRFPRRAARLLAKAAATKPAARELLRGHLISHPHLAAQAAGADAAAAKVIEDLGKRLVREADADLAQVPDVLVTPPWEARTKLAKPPVLALTSPGEVAVTWKPKEQAEWAALRTSSWKAANQSWEEALRSRIDTWGQVQLLAAAPPELVRPLLLSGKVNPQHAYDALDPARKLLGLHGEDALAYVMGVVRTRPTSLAPALLPVSGPEVAVSVAGWYARSKPLRPFALTWLNRHAATAARDLLPVAMGKAGKDRVAAESALRQLDRSVVLKAAEAYGAEARDAVAVVLDVDPLQLLPAKMPSFPSWLDVAHLPQVRVADRSGALPSEAVRNLVLMLMLCKPGETYAGVDVVKAAIEPASAADWAWGVFERWRAAEYPAKDGWVLEALALLGDDETVRQLAPLIRVWPGESAHNRAVTGLDVLRTIGSDVALMHLHRISEKASFKGLRSKAQERIAEVAEDLGLTAEQLADRLVPDLGLDDRGSMLLDYGARRFTVGFDEQLKPTVFDEDGSRRSVLPKPSAKDDPVLAPAAYAQFSGLKKDVKTIAQDQVRRLERAMVTGRSWTAEEHQSLFVEHPLVWHLSRRLVWRTADGASFRVAEDRTLASSADEETTVASDATVSLVHPLQLEGSELRAWSELFADYEILQPFPQLAREVFTLEPAERKAQDLTRFHLEKVATGRILGLTSKGWVRGDVMDGGVSIDTYRHIGGDRYVVLDLDPGIIVGMPMEWPEQKITKVSVTDGKPEWGSRPGSLTLDALDAVAASELIRDLEALKG